MARITDPEKLERIKQTTMELIVLNGYQGVTIANIAKKADVSAGYLYNHYSSKDELICVLIDECYPVIKTGVGDMLKAHNTFEEIFSHLFSTILEVANTQPIRAAFICALVHDGRFRDMFKLGGATNIHDGVSQLHAYGLEKKSISDDTTMTDMFLFSIDLPINYMYYRLKEKDEKGKITPHEVARLVNKALKALK